MPRIAALGAFACALAAGCVSTVRYPDKWPPPVASAPDCTGISGVYANRGSNVESHSFIGTSAGKVKPATLSSLFRSELLIDDVKDPHAGADRVRIDTSTPGSLKVAMIQAEREELLTFEEAKNQFKCAGGRIHMKWTKPVPPVALMIGAQGQENIFFRGQDGSLIVERQDWGAAMAMVIIPVAGGSQQWYRFEAVTPDARNSRPLP